MYGIVCVPLDSPKVLYLRHYETTSEGWTQTSLCRPCFKDYRTRSNPFLPTCMGSSSCRCQVCLRQPPSLRSLASYTVFHITYNLLEFALSSGTRYQHYVRAVTSNIVPVDRLIPRSFPKLSCTFVRATGCCISKRFHKACLTLLKSTGTLTPRKPVPPRMRLLLACLRTAMNGGVICAINFSSQLQAVCSASCVPLYICTFCKQ